SNAQAQSVEIPLPVTDQGIQAVVSATKDDSAVKTMMNEVRAGVITDMTSRPLDQLPLYNQVIAKMQPMMMQKLMLVQSKALMNPESGLPGFIAPPPF
ncbi:MAG: hypothetical protein D3904_17910, partial [Candidatus Electrothrix sp. EH2]|nr:hypothetical protein [Candidatus Electrothrix sp. EH2]